MERHLFAHCVASFKFAPQEAPSSCTAGDTRFSKFMLLPLKMIRLSKRASVYHPPLSLQHQPAAAHSPHDLIRVLHIHWLQSKCMGCLGQNKWKCLQQRYINASRLAKLFQSGRNMECWRDQPISTPPRWYTNWRPGRLQILHA